jgi:hypothetical protein
MLDQDDGECGLTGRRFDDCLSPDQLIKARPTLPVNRIRQVADLPGDQILQG